MSEAQPKTPERKISKGLQRILDDRATAALLLGIGSVALFSAIVLSLAAPALGAALLVGKYTVFGSLFAVGYGLVTTSAFANGILTLDKDFRKALNTYDAQK